MLLSIDHVQLSMPRGLEDEARAFYGGVLELTEVPKPEAFAGYGGCWFESAAVHVHLGVEEPFVPAGKAHPCFLVRSLDEAQRKLEVAGHVCIRADDIQGVVRFHTFDVFGNRLEFREG